MKHLINYNESLYDDDFLYEIRNILLDMIDDNFIVRYLDNEMQELKKYKGDPEKFINIRCESIKDIEDYIYCLENFYEYLRSKEISITTIYLNGRLLDSFVDETDFSNWTFNDIINHLIYKNDGLRSLTFGIKKHIVSR